MLYLLVGVKWLPPDGTIPNTFLITVINPLAEVESLTALPKQLKTLIYLPQYWRILACSAKSSAWSTLVIRGASQNTVG